MPREERLIEPGSYQHIYDGGVDGRSIFIDESDRRKFLDRATDIFRESETVGLVFALMLNHFHFIVLAGASVSAAMQRLLGGHTLSFNKRHDRFGPLWRDRFKNKTIESAPQLRIAILYVALNPVRARAVRTVDDAIRDPYCGLGALLGYRKDALVSDAAMRLFGDTIEAARAEILRRATWVLRNPGEFDEYERFLAAGNADEALDSGMNILDGEARSVYDAASTRNARVESVRNAGWTLDLVFAWVSSTFGVAPEVMLQRRNHEVADARAAFVFLARTELKEQMARIASFLSVVPAQVTKLFRRGRAIVLDRNLALPLTPTLIGRSEAE